MAMHLPLGLFIALIITCLTACDTGNSNARAALGPESWLPLRIGTIEFEAQIALTQEEQRKGLMNRDILPENGGMLFPYATPNRRSFWMANTRIPLDIGFFDESGQLREIHRLIPFDTSQTQSSSTQIKYALEMNQGWFSRHDIYPGQMLDLDMLEEAIRRRGGDPRAFGLGSSSR